MCVCYPLVLSAWHVLYLCLPFAALSDKIVLNIYAFLLWLLCLAGALKRDRIMSERVENIELLRA